MFYVKTVLKPATKWRRQHGADKNFGKFIYSLLSAGRMRLPHRSCVFKSFELCECQARAVEAPKWHRRSDQCVIWTNMSARYWVIRNTTFLFFFVLFASRETQFQFVLVVCWFPFIVEPYWNGLPLPSHRAHTLQLTVNTTSPFHRFARSQMY